MINKKLSNERIYNSLLGFAIGDMVGVPVEFKSKEFLEENPVRIFTGHKLKEVDKYHKNIPYGAWSDDTSLVLLTSYSLFVEKSLNKESLINEMWKWYHSGHFTYNFKLPFDVGHSTAKAIMNRHAGTSYDYDDIKNNGNGGLMRMLPIIFYVFDKKDREDIIKEYVSLTHGHHISIISTMIYAYVVWELIEGKTPKKATMNGINKGYKYANDNFDISKEVMDKTFKDIKRNVISVRYISEPTGYIVDTLNTVLWGFFHSKDYNKSLLKVINLGGDTDTNGALLGGLLGFYYGKIHWIFKLKLKNKSYLDRNFKAFAGLINFK